MTRFNRYDSEMKSLSVSRDSVFKDILIVLEVLFLKFILVYIMTKYDKEFN